MGDSLAQAYIAAQIDKLSVRGQLAFHSVIMRERVLLEDAAKAAGLTPEQIQAGLDELVEAGMIAYRVVDGVVLVSWTEV